jgi:hypothetical protein
MGVPEIALPATFTLFVLATLVVTSRIGGRRRAIEARGDDRAAGQAFIVVLGGGLHHHGGLSVRHVRSAARNGAGRKFNARQIAPYSGPDRTTFLDPAPALDQSRKWSTYYRDIVILAH